MKNYIAPIIGFLLIFVTALNTHSTTKSSQPEADRPTQVDSVKQSVAEWKQTLIQAVYENTNK